MPGQLNSQIDCHRGEVLSLSIINILISASLGSTCLHSAAYIWWGSASCKNNLGMCVRPYLYLSGNWELGDSVDSATRGIYSLNYYLAQPNSYSLLLHVHIS